MLALSAVIRRKAPIRCYQTARNAGNASTDPVFQAASALKAVVMFLAREDNKQLPRECFKDSPQATSQSRQLAV